MSYNFQQLTPVNGKAPSWAKDRAIDLLFGSSHISASQYEALHEFMDKRYEKCACVVMHYTEMEREKAPQDRREFSKLCDFLGLDPENREVIITNRQVKFYRDYSSPTYEVLLK